MNLLYDRDEIRGKLFTVWFYNYYILKNKVVPYTK